MANSEHSADEAGGDVFASDGLAPLSAPLPPPLPSADGGVISDDDAVIEETPSVDPHVAFETFVVKKDNGTGWGVLSASGAAIKADEVESFGVEDPRRRLFRLRAEVDALEAELAEESASGKVDGDEDVRVMTSDLKARLDAMGVGEDNTALASMLRGRQEDLSRVISRDLEKFSAASTSGEVPADASKVGEAGKIIYELYRTTGGSSATSPREAMLEERLRRLETAMGKSVEGEKSLLERLEDAERLAKEVDAKEVEKVAAKAKVIRSDLEAAARAKAKLASSSNNSSLTPQDAQTITALHNQLVELEGISTHLPALTVRLTELSNLHSNAAEFGARLDAAEGAVTRSEVVLRNVEEALRKMEVGWKENMEAVERNVKKLDELASKTS